MTPAAEELVTLAGTTGESFQEAAEKLLPKMASLRLSESTVQRTSESAGNRLANLFNANKVLGGPTPWNWNQDARGIRCAYVSIDATGVRQQACGGGVAEGRMPYVAMVFNPVPDLPTDHPNRAPPTASMQARYLSGLYDLGTLGQLLRRQAGQVGMTRAQHWIGLCDGGNGLENFLRVNFPGPMGGDEITIILDFWHASDSLTKLAKAIHPSDEALRQEVLTSWCHIMKHEGGSRIVEELEKLKPTLGRRTAKEQYDETVNYLRNNLHRMDYPAYLMNGWSIGSGAMESACKTVVGQRLKLAGMRWREPGTNEMSHLRALYRSEATQWDFFWARKTLNCTTALPTN